MKKIITNGDTIIDVNEIAYLSIDVEKDYKGEITKYLLCITFKANSCQHRMVYFPKDKQSMLDLYNTIREAMINQ